MENDTSSLNVTLDDELWKDSFDKLLDPRPLLRDLNVLKSDVRVSFNMNSSVENCSRGSDNKSSLLSQQSFLSVPHIINKHHKNVIDPQDSISTPVSKHLLNPFKCSLSPITSWDLKTFDNSKKRKKLEMAVNRKFHATLNKANINKENEEDYDIENVAENQILTAAQIKDINISVPQPDSPLTLLAKKTTTLKRKDCPPRTRNVLFKNLTNLSDQNHSKYDFIKNVMEHSKKISAVNLAAGKWRKSLNIWRRTHQGLPEDRKNSILKSKRREYPERISSALPIGLVRKSIILDTQSDSKRQSQLKNHFLNGNWENEILQRCNQRKVLSFEKKYNFDKISNGCKIGEGAFGEVFKFSIRNQEVILKIIPIEGSLKINGELQKTFKEILPEIVISMELTNLNNHSFQKFNCTSGFVSLKKVSYVKGKYPELILKYWDDYDYAKGSDNEKPAIFDDSQLFIALELEFSGQDMEEYSFLNAEQTYYALQQVIATLAVGEEACQFEHRDLHIGNILIMKTVEKHISFKLNGKQFTIPTKGIKTTIIDYTLSRMTYDSCCLYNDLSTDEELFEATGDYQFDIYRMMREIVKNKWEVFEPKTNVLWISYLIHKLLNGILYRKPNSKTHGIFLQKIKDLSEIVMNFKSASDCAISFLKTNKF